MYQLGLVAIGGGNGRSSVFSAPLQNQFHAGASMGGLFTWYSDQQYYNMAKAAVASFDQLSARVARIADKAARDKIIRDYGMNDARPGDTSLNKSTLSERNQVQGWINKADATGDPGDGFADDGKHGRKVTDWLIDYVNDISSDVQNAELTYGMLPTPQAPVVQAAPAAPAPEEGASALPYILGGAGVAAVLLVAGVI